MTTAAARLSWQFMEARTRIHRQIDASCNKAGNVKLTANQVRQIRNLIGVVTGESLARRFGVTRGAISAIKHRKTWAHI